LKANQLKSKTRGVVKGGGIQNRQGGKEAEKRSSEAKAPSNPGNWKGETAPQKLGSNPRKNKLVKEIR